jgi:hypothetical protein
MPKFKMKNNHFLQKKKKYIVFILFYKMMDQNLNFFRKKEKLNTP